MKVKYIDLEMGLLAVVIAFTAFINISTFHIANYRDVKILMLGRNMGMFHASGWGKYCVLWNV